MVYEIMYCVKVEARDSTVMCNKAWQPSTAVSIWEGHGGCWWLIEVATSFAPELEDFSLAGSISCVPSVICHGSISKNKHLLGGLKHSSNYKPTGKLGELCVCIYVYYLYLPVYIYIYSMQIVYYLHWIPNKGNCVEPCIKPSILVGHSYDPMLHHRLVKYG